MNLLMVDRYSYIDPIIRSTNENHKSLSVEESDKAVLHIFRVLSGTCKLVDDFDDKKYKLDVNYFFMPFSKNEKFNQKTLVDILPDEMDLKQMADVFLRLNKNKEFYELIRTEVVNCVIARQKGRYLESFLFLYRILEGISYSIPLMYTAKSKSFRKSFKALQKYMPKNAIDGEIVFFKKFINEVYNQEGFYRSTMDIKLDDIDIEELRPIYYEIYKNKLKDESIMNDIEDEELQVSFIGFFEFMIELRNRYFHFLQGSWHDNISTTQIIYPDVFFKPIIDLGINWVAIVLYEVIKFDIEQLDKN